MALGQLQKIIIEKSKQPEGVTFDFIKEIYGNIAQAKAAISKLVSMGHIKQVEGSQYPIVYKHRYMWEKEDDHI